MSTTTDLKSGRYNELEGIALSAVFRSLPLFLMMAWQLKHRSGFALFNQPGVALTLAVMTSVAFPVLLRYLELRFPDGYRGSCEPSFYDASLSVPQKLLGWCKNRKWESAGNAILAVLLTVYVGVKGSF
jgi:hypothetical protein